MPAKRRPPFEMEPGEGKAHEAAESPEEETREGAEEQEGENYPMKSRKRSARGAKRTKAPMDAEGGCCNEKKGKAPCAACAAGKACSGAKRGGAKADGDFGSRSGGGCVSGPGTRLASSCSRGDALTPWEYLDACDLGIQDRSRAYIRARLDAEQRLDAGVKCGGGYIAQGKKCRATGGGAMPSRPGRTGGKGLRSTEGGGPSRVEKVENFIIKNGTALNRVATVGSLVAGFQGRNKLASALGKVGTVSGVASNAALYAQGARTQNEAKKAQASFGLGMTAGALAVRAHFKRQNQQATVNRIKDYRNKINKEVSALPAGIQSEARKSNHTWLKRHIKESTGNLPLSAARRRKTKPVPLKQQLRSLWADGFSYDSTALAV